MLVVVGSPTMLVDIKTRLSTSSAVTTCFYCFSHSTPLSSTAWSLASTRSQRSYSQPARRVPLPRGAGGPTHRTSSAGIFLLARGWRGSRSWPWQRLDSHGLGWPFVGIRVRLAPPEAGNVRAGDGSLARTPLRTTAATSGAPAPGDRGRHLSTETLRSTRSRIPKTGFLFVPGGVRLTNPIGSGLEATRESRGTDCVAARKQDRNGKEANKTAKSCWRAAPSRQQAFTRNQRREAAARTVRTLHSYDRGSAVPLFRGPVPDPPSASLRFIFAKPQP